ncbi:hypothetical protein MMIC_P1414 [Mariprofundus micogutta]|uniref:Uncharacterized protein n=1 Tax=Mariprofundus micogutta TaxID=1921010 RepID=A0A1L8CNM7_9PROT|nr:hypothetical protein [Mariprofundus micogutta]GAV20449.1 hypothetical protein MMIC_P1414 [Mariprofundus micogutta]
MSENKETPELQGDSSDAGKAEDVISVSDTSSASSGEEKKSSSGILKFLAFLLIVAGIVGGGLYANGELGPVLDSAKSAFHDVKAQLSSGPESDASQEASEPIPAETEHEFASSEPVQSDAEFAAEAVPAEPDPSGFQSAPESIEDHSVVAASGQVEELQATINALRSEMQAMEESQSVLREKLLEQQQFNLQARLRWITDPASHLPQLQMAWEEIASMPELSAERRETAVAMQALAENSSQALLLWHDSLNKWSDSLAIPEQEDVLQEPEHPWLAWLVGQFHLRKAPSTEAKRLAGLSQRLSMAASQLGQEKLPNHADWQALRAELLLHVTSTQGQTDSSSVELGLPDDFSAIQADIQKLRDTAVQWVQSKQGEV